MLPITTSVVEISCGNLNLSMKHFQNAINELKLACETMRVAAGENSQYVFQPLYRKFQYGMPTGRSLDEAMELIASKMHSAAWLHLIDKIKMDYLMTKGQYEEFKAKMNDNPQPFTPDAVGSLFMDLVKNREKNTIDGLIAFFESLSGEFKRHNSFSISTRIIIKHVCRKGLINSIKNIHYVTPFDEGSKGLRDMYRAIELLLSPNKVYATENDILEKINKHLKEDPEAIYEDELLKIKLCDNGNAHVSFRSIQIVDSLNKEISEHYPFQLPQ